jgi:hypothetical protein
MTQPTHKGLTFLAILIFACVAWAQDENGIRSFEAKNHIGEIAMVCGVIVSIRRESPLPASERMGSYYVPPNPTINGTLLYFDKFPPHHEFFVYIKDEYRKALPVEPESFVDRKACVYGKIAKDNGLRQVIALVRTYQIAVEGIEMDGK